MLRLRSGAVSLSRQAQKAQLQLEKLRKAQPHSVEPASAPQPVTPSAWDTVAPQASKQEAPPAEKIPAPTEGKGKIAAYAQAHGLTYSQAMQQRNREMRLAERQAKLERRAAASKAA